MKWVEACCEDKLKWMPIIIHVRADPEQSLHVKGKFYKKL